MRRLLICTASVAALACGRSPVVPIDPALRIEPAAVRFVARPNEVVTAVPVSVTGQGGLPLDFTAVPEAGWVVVTPRRGTTPAVVMVSVLTSGVPLGTNRTVVRFRRSETGADVPEIAITVELELASPGWTSLEGPHAAATISLAVAPGDPSLVLAGTRRGAVLRSTDGGTTFTRVPALFPDESAEVWGVTLDADAAGFVASSGGLYRTDDAGLSFSPTGLAAAFTETVVVHPTDPQRVLAEGSQTFFSTNGGADFAQVPTPDPWFAQLDPTGSAIFMIGGDDGVIYVGDGPSFAPLAQFHTQPVTAFVVTPAGRWVLASTGQPDHNYIPCVAVSDDEGGSWEIAGVGLPAISDQPYFLLWQDGAVLYAGHSTGLYRSTDGAETFNRVPPPVAHAAWDGAWPVAMARAGERLLFALRGDGVFALGSDDVWTPAANDDIEVWNVAFHPPSGQLVVSTNVASIYRYTPGGGFAGIGGEGLYFTHIYSLGGLSLDPRNPAVIWVYGYGSGVQRTLDGGLTWDGVDTGAGTYVYGLARSWQDPDVLWLGSEVGVFLTDDNGLNFVQVASRGAGIATVVDADAAVFESGGDLIRVTRDGNVTEVWDHGNGHAWYVTRAPDGTLWATGDSGLLRSDDGGQSFAFVGWRDTEWWGLVVDDNDPSRLFVATPAGASESRDGGLSFHDLGCPFPGENLALDSAGRRLFVGTSLGGVWVYAYDP